RSIRVLTSIPARLAEFGHDPRENLGHDRETMLCRQGRLPVFGWPHPSGETCKMALRLLAHIELPAHRADGGFDHADIHPPTDRLYVAHTCNDSIDVIDCAQDRYLES